MSGAFRFPIALIAALIAAMATGAEPSGAQSGSRPEQEDAEQMADHPYVGMWVTDDGHIRHELLPNGRYDEARGTRESAYQGRYEIKGDHIEYWDDAGFRADGDFIDGVLHHAGMVLRRAK